MPIRKLKAVLGASLLRQVMAVTATGLTIASLAFLLILQIMQTRFLLAENERASMALNTALQAALENVMLKRDLAGLQTIVDGIAATDTVSGAMIIAPNGEIRFADRHERVGRALDEPLLALALSTGAAQTGFRGGQDGPDILRSVNPVHNKPECNACHGATAAHPINGLLVLDFAAAPIRAYARRATLTLIGMGGIVMVLLAGALWWSLGRVVTGRLARVREAVRTFGRGDLGARLHDQGTDEISSLAQTFDMMADRLERADAELHTTLEALESILEAAPDGIRVIGPDYRVLHANSTHLKRLGLSREEAIGAPCHVMTHARDTPCPATIQICPVQKILREGGGAMRFVDLFHLPTGRTMNADVIAAPVQMSVNGAPQDCVIEVIRNLDAEVELSHQQRLSEIAMLANGVAHEINTPLSSILLAVHAMRDDLPEGSAGLDFADLIETEIESCMSVTESLMRLSMPTARTVEAVDLGAAARSVMRLLRPELERAGIQAELITDDPVVIEAGDSDMRILLLNLATNAIHAMPGGGTLSVVVERGEGEAILKVSDTGTGIAPEHLGDIFLPFWTRRPDGSAGRGLGLAICRQVVDRLGGRIDVVSRPEQGATFSVHLPLVQGTRHAAAGGGSK